MSPAQNSTDPGLRRRVIVCCPPQPVPEGVLNQQSHPYVLRARGAMKWRHIRPELTSLNSSDGSGHMPQEGWPGAVGRPTAEETLASHHQSGQTSPYKLPTLQSGQDPSRGNVGDSETRPHKRRKTSALSSPARTGREPSGSINEADSLERIELPDKDTQSNNVNEQGANPYVRTSDALPYGTGADVPGEQPQSSIIQVSESPSIRISQQEDKSTQAEVQPTTHVQAEVAQQPIPIPLGSSLPYSDPSSRTESSPHSFPTTSSSSQQPQHADSQQVAAALLDLCRGVGNEYINSPRSDDRSQSVSQQANKALVRTDEASSQADSSPKDQEKNIADSHSPPPRYDSSTTSQQLPHSDQRPAQPCDSHQSPVLTSAIDPAQKVNGGVFSTGSSDKEAKIWSYTDTSPKSVPQTQLPPEEEAGVDTESDTRASQSPQPKLPPSTPQASQLAELPTKLHRLSPEPPLAELLKPSPGSTSAKVTLQKRISVLVEKEVKSVSDVVGFAPHLLRDISFFYNNMDHFEQARPGREKFLATHQGRADKIKSDLQKSKDMYETLPEYMAPEEVEEIQLGTSKLLASQQRKLEELDREAEASRKALNEGRIVRAAVIQMRGGLMEYLPKLIDAYQGVLKYIVEREIPDT